MRFPAVIHKDEESGYGVTVPDLPGCFSAGDTLEEAIESAHEAVACHIEGLLMDGEQVPEQAPLEVHQANEDGDGVWALVAVDISKLSSKAKRINITVPAGCWRSWTRPPPGKGRRGPGCSLALPSAMCSDDRPTPEARRIASDG